MSQNETGNLFKRVFNAQTDHGGMKLGDVIVLILDTVLLIYSAYWSWHFMQAPLPDADKMVALVGLWGLDVGAVFWSLTWIFGSTTTAQDAVSLSMFVIDLIGMTITSLVGSLGLTSAVGSADVSRWAVGIIIMLNIVMGFIYHMTSPQTAAGRKRRKTIEEIAKDERKAALDIERERLQLESTERMLAQRQSLIERQREATRQTLELDGIRAGLDAALKNSQKLTGSIADKERTAVEAKAHGNGDLQHAFASEIKPLADTLPN